MHSTGSRLPFLIGLSLACLVPAGAAEAPALPATPKKPVTSEYHGTKVTEEYRWLEDVDHPDVVKWVKDQNRYTRSVLDKLPAANKLRNRLAELFQEHSARYEHLIYNRGLLFAVKDDTLVTLKSADAPETARVLVDPDLALPNKNATIDTHLPSLDEKHVAVVLSEAGKEEGALYVYEVATGKKLPDVIPRVFTASGGSVAWKGDGSGFYYTRHLRDDEVRKAEDKCRQPAYFHKLGTPPADDVYVFGKDLPRLAGVALETSEDGRYLLAGVSHGTDSHLELHALGPAGKWTQICRFADHITGARIGPEDTLYLLSEHDAARGKVLRVPLAKPHLAQAKTIVPEGEGVIRDFVLTDRRLYVVDRVEGAARARSFDLNGQAEKPVPVKPMSAVGEMLRLKGDEVLFQNETYLEPPAWYRFDPATGKTTRTGLLSTSRAEFSDTEVVREFAVSKDGTKVPLTILRRKGTPLDGRNPTLLLGYGGYGENEGPNFQASRRVWLDQGGIYAIAHPRGDGEYGADWHRAGKLTKKQNVFDDFAACAKHLIARKYTSKDRLAIEGGSNGGLLMGVALTQHPDLFRAVVAHVGVYDMLRFELHSNGLFSVTEFGTVKNAEHFKAMYAYSPYHRVADGTAYPGVLLTTGINDNRVPPYESWKMAARLQAATSSLRPILLWTSFTSGHDLVAPGEEVSQQADIFAFLFHQLGVPFKEPSSPLPKTPKKPVNDDLHGVKVIDPYRWHEHAGESAVKGEGWRVKGGGWSLELRLVSRHPPRCTLHEVPR